MHEGKNFGVMEFQMAMLLLCPLKSGAVLDRLGNGSLIFDREFLKGSVCVASATTSQPTTLYRMSRDFFAQTVQGKR